MPQLTVPHLAQAIACGFAAGALLLLLLTLLPTSRSVAKQLWPVLASEAVILAGGIVPWFIPRPVLFCILILAACRIGFESGTVYSLATGKRLVPWAILVLAVASASAWLAGTAVVLGVGVLTLCAALATLFLHRTTSLSKYIARFAIFPLLPLAAFSHAAAEPHLAPYLVLAFFLVEIFDSFSLLGGKLYGRTPLVPRLSPRKTWEGLATGAGALTFTIMMLAAWLDLAIQPVLTIGAVVVLTALAGDLLGSQPKRRAGVKDYPAVMAVQGGLLDITDAWLVAGPCIAGLAGLLHWF